MVCYCTSLIPRIYLQSLGMRPIVVCYCTSLIPRTYLQSLGMRPIVVCYCTSLIPRFYLHSLGMRPIVVCYCTHCVGKRDTLPSAGCVLCYASIVVDIASIYIALFPQLHDRSQYSTVSNQKLDRGELPLCSFILVSFPGHTCRAWEQD